MLKNILNLEGAQKLSNKEQKEINGGTMIEVTPPKCNCDGIQVASGGRNCLIVCREL